MIQAHIRHMTAAGYAANTIRDAGRLLDRVNAELPFGLPTALPEELAEWLAQQGQSRETPDEGWSRQTRKTYRDHLCRFYRWAADTSDPWIDTNPATGLRAPRVPVGLPRPATDEQVRICVTRAAQPWRLHCMLAAHAGLRPCEIARLRREDIDEQWVHIHLGKGDKSRRIPTHRRIWAAVEPLPAGPLTHRRTATAQWVSQATARHIRRTLRIDVTLYNLRHWYGTRVQAAQGDIRVTQELMGHSSPVTTSRYTQVSDRRLRSAIDALPDLG